MRDGVVALRRLRRLHHFVLVRRHHLRAVGRRLALRSHTSPSPPGRSEQRGAYPWLLAAHRRGVRSHGRSGRQVAIGGNSPACRVLRAGWVRLGGGGGVRRGAGVSVPSAQGPGDTPWLLGLCIVRRVLAISLCVGVRCTRCIALLTGSMNRMWPSGYRIAAYSCCTGPGPGGAANPRDSRKERKQRKQRKQTPREAGPRQHGAQPKHALRFCLAMPWEDQARRDRSSSVRVSRRCQTVQASVWRLV